MSQDERPVRISSFGFKFGDPPEGAKVVDCRALPNPHSNPELRRLTGKKPAVQTFVCEDYRVSKIVKNAYNRALRGEDVAFGCIGGKHRSVALAEITARLVKAMGHSCEVVHRELGETRLITRG